MRSKALLPVFLAAVIAAGSALYYTGPAAEDAYTAAAADDVRCKYLLPVHIGKFCLSTHAWDEPFKFMKQAAPLHDWHLLTPRMGEVIALDAPGGFSSWWEGLS